MCPDDNGEGKGWVDRRGGRGVGERGSVQPSRARACRTGLGPPSFPRKFDKIKLLTQLRVRALRRLFHQPDINFPESQDIFTVSRVS